MKRKQQQPSITNFFAKRDDAPNKKPKPVSDDECIIILDDADAAAASGDGSTAGQQAGRNVAGAGGAAADTNAAAAAPPPPSPPSAGVQHKPQAAHTSSSEQQRQLAQGVVPAVPAQRNAAAHTAAQAKLVTARTATGDLDTSGQQQQQHNSVSAGGQGARNRPKYTPLEQQVVALKAAHPGVMLLVEVGYKMRLFGDDAEVAARELGIYCYTDHNFPTASFPVQRLPIHVRRLVAAGHKVGVVRQTESAALKAAGDNRSAPFTRSLTGLFTAATLEAAEKADKLGEASFMEVSQELESVLGGSSRSPAASYILVLAQEGGSSSSNTNNSNSGQAIDGVLWGCVGLLAVDAGSGDIAYGLSSSTDSSSSSSNSRSSKAASTSGSAAAAVMPLETVLLSLTPSDLVVCDPVSPATEQVLKAYMAGASRKCRLERLQQQQQQAGPPTQQHKALTGVSGGGGGSGGGGYLDAARMNALVDFFSEQPAPAAAGSSKAANSSTATAATAASAAGLQFVLSLPQPVLSALAGALCYLGPFGLTEVLRCTSSYRALTVGGTVTLDGNALRQLEVLESGVEAAPQLRGSLLHLLDRCSTAAGGRLLRRWLAAPLADRASILDRQTAVQVLLDSISGTDSKQHHPQQHVGSSSSGVASGGVLQLLPKWLSATRQDLERGLARVAAGTAAPAEAVGLWSKLAQLPSALQLPLQQQKQQPVAASDTPAAPPACLLDTEALSALVPSRLLVSLLAAAAGSDVVGPAADTLSRLDVTAAAKNEYLALFKSQQHFPEVFACQAAVSAAEDHLQQLLPQLASTAGVASLSYVSILNQGNYLVELPAARTKVPKGWDKVCATKKVCRYHPAEVKRGMSVLAQAQEQLQAACGAAWTRLLREFTAAHHAAFRQAVAAVAQLDALQALAVVASSPGYCRPQFVEEGEPQQLTITEGKHPMLDLALDGTAVANSLNLTWDVTRAAIITGPNMGGKSVLIRQAALTVIMAQLGSWVPAASCVLGVFDGVFCRMGASDCLMLGRSTFAEELGEASHILATATNRSLVIMDELGRGTATHDGVAIACSTLLHLVSHTQCLSLFVTHYPEVASLAARTVGSTSTPHTAASPCDQQHLNTTAADVAGGTRQAAAPAVVCAAGAAEAAAAAAAGGLDSSGGGHIAVYHMSFVRQDSSDSGAAAAAGVAAITPQGQRSAGGEAVESRPDQQLFSAAAAADAPVPVITFLYKLAEGAADESFGLNVAQMAGLPISVVQRAAVIARQLKHRVRATDQGALQQQPQQQQQQPHEQQESSVSHEGGVESCWQLCCQVREALQQAAQKRGLSSSHTPPVSLLELQAVVAKLLAAAPL